MALLDETRIAVSLVPERLIARAAQAHGVDLARVEPEGADFQVLRNPRWRDVLEDALKEWPVFIPVWRRLPFDMQHQQQDQWCWSATSVSVALYYAPTSGWTQCDMVNSELGQTTCCQDGSTAQCNQPHSLNAPLDRARVLDRMQNGSVSYSTLRLEIDAGRPLAWRIGWSGGGGHFAVIEGYQEFGDEWVAVDDPWYGASDVAVSTLTGGSYQGSGTWTHSYFTRRPAGRVLDRARIPTPIWRRIRDHQGEVIRNR